MVQTLTEEVFIQTIKESPVPIVIDFHAPWCGPCRAMGPILEELSVEMENVQFAKLDIDENPLIAQMYGIRSIPMFMIVSDGKNVAAVLGARPKEEMKQWIEENTKTPD